jgi:hypothetical protein
MTAFAFDWPRERVPERSRTLVAKGRTVWIWPGIPLTSLRGGEIVPADAETIRFWVTRLHGPEALDKGILRSVAIAADCLKRGNETAAQAELDSLRLIELSQDGALLMRAVAPHIGIEALDLPLRASMQTWNAQDIALHLPIYKRHAEAAQGLTKGVMPFAPLGEGGWDPAKHPRWPAGAPDSQGGQFAPGDEGDFASGGDPQGHDRFADHIIQIAAKGPYLPGGVILIQHSGVRVNPLDPKGLNRDQLTPAELLAIADTANILVGGDALAIRRLVPHSYQNFPDKDTGAVMPPGAYTSYKIPGQGDWRLIIDRITGTVYFTNLHYKAFYRVLLIP